MKRVHKKVNIGVLTFPTSEAGNIPLRNLIDILYPLSNDLYLITGNDGYTFFKDDKRIHTYGIKHERGANVFTRILKFLYTQLRISCKLAKVSRGVDLWIFFLAGECLVLSILIAKLLRKRVIIASSASGAKTTQAQRDPLAWAVAVLQSIGYSLSDCIILYSPNLIKEWNLEKYRNKISIAHEHFIDFDKFKIKKKIDERENLVGYIGRLSGEKGVLNFVEAIPQIIKEKDDLKFLIGGDGQLREKIERYLEEENLNDKVKLPGWVPREEFLTSLNKLKLFVLPSYTEGFPHTILEAMACGTPVLATPVGAIPDVIEDGETGFIMEDNSPECIAKNITRALDHPNLEQITKNARALVEREFTYEKAVENYRKILDEVSEQSK